MKKMMVALAFVAGLALPAFGQTPEEQIVQSLEAQGFHLIVRDRTWLGRIWMVLEDGQMRREIVFNPGTGEILRDYSVMLVATVDGPGASGDKAGTAALAAAAGVKAPGPVEASDSAMSSVVVAPGEPLLILPAPGN